MRLLASAAGSALLAARLLLLLLPPPLARAARNYDAHDYYAVHLRHAADPRDVAARIGLAYEGPLGELEDHHLFRAEGVHHQHDHVQAQLDDLRRRRRKRAAGADAPHALDHVLLSQKQDLQRRFPLVKRSALPPPPPPPARRQGVVHPIDSAVQKGLDIAKALGIEDPIFQEQWHLYNHVQIGHDINVTGVWSQGVTGKNTAVCIVDDGLDMDSDDLRDNYFAAGSYDFNDQVADPKPRLSDDHHGTRCAGEVAAVRNDVCGVGVAYEGKVAGVRILSKVISDADEAIAMNYAFQQNQIYSCSWGPPDDGQAMEQPGILIRRAMLTGVQKGRQGLGSIYVFAIGNGAANDDNCNFDGYTNSIYSVSVGGIDRKGLHPYYSEKCSAQLVVTYSSGSGDAIHTTDVGKDKCYTNHGGTSAAGPLVAGIYALMLQVNPALTWRDIQWLTVLTAVKLDNPSDWVMNAAVGKEFSHQYGYGKADAYALVEAARTWTNVKPQAWYWSPWMHVRHAIPQGDQGLASTFDVTAEMLREANLARLEHVTVTMNVQHTRRGDLSAELHSPSGMVSHIATHRRNDAANSGYVDWTFMSVAHWGESGVGTWTVVVKDTNVNEHTGTFTDWRLRLWGEAITADGQPLLPMPTEDDDRDHDRDHDRVHAPGVHTTSVVLPTETGQPEGNPDDHQHRPVNSKTSTTAASAPATAKPGGGGDDPEDEVRPPGEGAPNPAPSSAATSSAGSDHLLPHIFPTFGVTKTTQAWIYGSVVLILLFLISLGSYLFYIRRKRRRWMSPTGGPGDYGFEMVDHDEARDGLMGGDGEARGGGKRAGPGRKKAGMLYDAFAPDESEADDDDDDDDDDHDGSGEDAGRERFEVGTDEDSDGEDEGRGRPGAGRYRDDDEPLREGTAGR